MQKIRPNLWFEGNAKEAVEYYVSLFPDSGIIEIVNYPETMEEGLADFQLGLAGKPLSIEFELDGYSLIAINAGPEFKFNPSLSFTLSFNPSNDLHAREHLDELWEKLADGGKVLMPLDKYPYSERYGWIQDRYGLSWQLMLTEPEDTRPFIVPSLMFAGENTNHAREAIEDYLTIFKNSRPGTLAPYGEDTGPAKAGSLSYADFTLEDQLFIAMDSGVEMDVPFNEAVSFEIRCKDQTEIDYFWAQLSAYPDHEQCGWIKDKHGVSWQIVPENINELMMKPDAYAKLMEMKKIIVDDF